MTNRRQCADNGPVSIGIVKVGYGDFEGSAGGDMGHVDVVFADSREPGFEIVVTIERIYSKPERPGGSPWRTRCVGVAYRPTTSSVGSSAGPDLRMAWLKRFPMERIVEEAREAARELEADANRPPLPRLPPGSPRRVNRREWYAALLRFVDYHLSAEMAPMDVYRMIASRKDVDVNNVKQWVFQARQIQEEG